MPNGELSYRQSRMPLPGEMDTAIDLSDASKALDLANIRFQLMYEVLHAAADT